MSPKLCRLVLAQVELKHNVAGCSFQVCLCLYSHSVFLNCSVSGHFGVSFSGAKGSVERRFLPISSSAGVYPLCSGVDL